MSKSKKVAKNTLYLYLRMFLTMGVTLYTSRVVLDVLGASDYGVYTVIGGVVTMFGFFNMAMASATQRFLSFEIGTRNTTKLQQTFSAAVTIHLGIAILVLILGETIGLWLVKEKLNIAPDRMGAAIWVYHFAVFSFMANIVQVPYNALIMARERMNIYAIYSIVEVFLKLTIVYLLIVSPFDKLKTYGALLFAVTFFIALIYRIYCIRYFPESKYKYRYDSYLYKTLISFSGWSLFGNLAAVFRSQGSNILLNIFFGTVVNAAYGISSQVNSAVRLFVSNFQAALNPQIVKTYARGDTQQNHKLILQGSKLSFFLLFIIVCPVWFNVDYILSVWLKHPPEYTSVFVRLALINMLFDCLSGPLMIGIQASGNIKWYQIVVGLFILLDLPVTYVVLNHYEEPALSYVVSIIITLFSLILRLYFLNKCVGINASSFFRYVFLRIIIVSISTSILIFYSVKLLSIKNETMEFIVSTIYITGLNLIVILWVGLSKNELGFLKSFLIKQRNGR